MKKFTIEAGSGTSAILMGESLNHLDQYISTEKTVIITDYNVWQLYSNAFPDCEVIRIGTGEGIKTLETVESLYDELLARNIDRSDFIVGIGGGIVCDIAGFVASTYMRGIRFGFVSSTLLSQVDAGVGGKNGVNFRGFKNMVGVFNQPEFVICDFNLLKTLPKRELLCGFAEIVKHAVIADARMFEYLEENYARALALYDHIIEQLVYDSIVIKSAIVSRDEKESGERRKLNFGHTFGHAIEKTLGVPHGEAVSTGMAFAADLSVKRGGLAQEKADRISDLIGKLELPIHRSGDRQTIVDALQKDKKRSGDAIHFVLLRDIGEAFVEEISMAEIEALVDRMY